MSSNRRRFLQSVGLAGIAGSGLARTSIAVPATDFAAPVIGRQKSQLPILKEKTGARIQSIETLVGDSNLALVRVRTDDGSEGWGQLSNYDADFTAQILHRKVARYGLGQDPVDIDLIVDRCIEGNYKFPWSYVCRALTGLDTAVWDLLGKRAGKPVCELLGGRPQPFPVYGSSMSRTIKPEDEANRLVRLRDAHGYGAFKIRVGSVCGHDADQWPGRTENLIPTVRKAVGNDVRLLVDGNSCYTPPKAIEVGRLLEEHDYCHFEEPCPYWELEWTAQVTEAIKVPVAGGEQDNDLAQWRRMVRMRAVDIVQPDICYVGGLTRALRVADMAATEGLPCVPHSANVSLVTVFTLHMMGAISNAGDHIEYSIEKTDWAESFYEPALEVKDGKVSIPDEPGWGIRIRSDWLEQATRQVST
jgi:L-alanine-DL-glutamate epimerase-like enolase superfamily enzyme